MKLIRYFLIISLFFNISQDLIGQRIWIKIDSLFLELKKADEISKGDIYEKIGYYYSKGDSLVSGIKYLNSALFYGMKFNQEEIIIKARCHLGDIYEQMDDVYNAEIQYLKAYQLSNNIENDSFLIYSCSGLGSVYQLKKEWTKSRFYIQKALKIATEYNVTSYYPKLINLMGMAYTGEELYDSALFYYNKLLEFGKQSNDSLKIGVSYVNMAYLRMNQKNFADAIILLEKAKRISKINSNLRAMSSLLANMGECKLYLKSYKESLENIYKSNKIAINQNFMAIKMLNYKNLSDLYLATGKLDSSLVNYKLYTACKDSIYDVEKQKSIQSIMMQNQQEESDKQISAYKQKALIRSLYLYFSSFIILLIILISVLLYRSFKLKIKLQNIEKEKMVGTIDQQNRALVGLAMNLGQKKQLISKVEESVKSMKNDVEKSELNTMFDDINSKLKTDSYFEQNWELFIKHFKDVHPSFFTNLEEKHPNLTQGELKHCAFIKLNLGLKEVAIMNNINVRSVQMIRYRLKKKFTLLATDDLSKYIQQI